MEKEDIIFAIEDSKRRPIVAIRSNGLASFYRYPDMSAEEKDVVLKYFSALKEHNHLSAAFAEKGVEDIADYLDFKSGTGDDFCG